MIINPAFTRNFHMGVLNSTLRSCFQLRNREIAHFPLFQDMVKREIYVSTQQRRVFPIAWTSPFYHPYISSNRVALFDLNRAVPVLSRVNFVQQNQMAKMARRHYELHRPSQPFHIESRKFENSGKQTKPFNPFWVSAFFFSILFGSLANNKKVSADEKDPDRLSLEECREVAKILNLTGYVPSPILSPEQQLVDFNAVCFTSAYALCEKGVWEPIGSLQKKGLLHRILSDKGENLFLYAIRKGDRHIFDMCRNYQCLYRGSDSHGNRALHYLALYDRHEWIRKLDEWNVDVDIPNNKGELAIHLAIREGYLQCIENLVNIGTNLELDILMSEGYSLPLVGYAVYHGRIDSLNTLFRLDSNQRIHLPQKIDKIGSLLHLSIERGHKKVLDALITLFGDSLVDLLSRPDDLGRFPFHVACYKGNTYAIRTLLRFGQDLKVLDKDLQSGFHLAVMGLQPEVIHYLYSLLGKEEGNQLLMSQNSQGKNPIDYLNSFSKMPTDDLMTRKNLCRLQIHDLFTSSGTKIPPPVYKTQHVHHLIIGSKDNFNITFNTLLNSLENIQGNEIVDIGGYGLGIVLAPLIALGYTKDDLLKEKLLIEFCRDLDILYTKKIFFNKLKTRIGNIKNQNGFLEFLNPWNLFSDDYRQLNSDINSINLILDPIKNEVIIKTKKLIQQIACLIKNKVGDKKITFGQLHEKVCSNSCSSFKDLHLLFIDCDKTNKWEVVNWENKKNSPIIDYIKFVIHESIDNDKNLFENNLHIFPLGILPLPFDVVIDEEHFVPNQHTLEIGAP